MPPFQKRSTGALRIELINSSGVYDRSAKAISPSAEACASLGIDERSYTPDELISSILRAPVDLFWNGGIGTYVKSSDESHADVGDKANDNIRIDATELRCSVIGEGGNLGMTQLGRIEFCELDPPQLGHPEIATFSDHTASLVGSVDANVVVGLVSNVGV